MKCSNYNNPSCPKVNEASCSVVGNAVEEIINKYNLTRTYCFDKNHYVLYLCHTCEQNFGIAIAIANRDEYILTCKGSDNIEGIGKMHFLKATIRNDISFAGDFFKMLNI